MYSCHSNKSCKWCPNICNKACINWGNLLSQPKYRAASIFITIFFGFVLAIGIASSIYRGWTPTSCAIYFPISGLAFICSLYMSIWSCCRYNTAFYHGEDDQTVEYV